VHVSIFKKIPSARRREVVTYPGQHSRLSELTYFLSLGKKNLGNFPICLKFAFLRTFFMTMFKNYNKTKV
jgi:hypothetical protein